jgi:hypothetical protein
MLPSKMIPTNNRIVLQRNYDRDNNEFVKVRFGINMSGTLGTGQVNPGVS